MNVYSVPTLQRVAERMKPLLAALLCGTLLSACGVSGHRPSSDGPGNDRRALRADEVQVENLPKSRYGNMDTYRVFGKQYKVLDTAENFVQEGVASWYGTKFHGRKTSSGEIYDMHALTAAHKHLPLPTFARVTNLDNGSSVVVKVNDRGPFVGDRIIDMSYAAAMRLGMTKAGTANVHVEALSTHHVAQAPSLSDPNNSSTAVVQPAQTQAVPLQAKARKVKNVPIEQSSYYIQLGAFKHAPNADILVANVTDKIGKPAYVERDAAKALFRVKMGPFQSGDYLNSTLSELASAGIESYTTLSKTQ